MPASVASDLGLYNRNELYWKYTGFREITDHNVLDLQCIQGGNIYIKNMNKISFFRNLCKEIVLVFLLIWFIDLFFICSWPIKFC